MWGLLCFELPEQTGMLFLCLEAEHTYPAHTIAAGALLTKYKGSSEGGGNPARKSACFQLQPPYNLQLFQSHSGTVWHRLSCMTFLPSLKEMTRSTTEMGSHQLSHSVCGATRTLSFPGLSRGGSSTPTPPFLQALFRGNLLTRQRSSSRKEKPQTNQPTKKITTRDL